MPGAAGIVPTFKSFVNAISAVQQVGTVVRNPSSMTEVSGRAGLLPPAQAYETEPYA